MKPVRLGDLRQLLDGPVFSEWWSEYARRAAAAREAEARGDNLRAQARAMAARAHEARRAAGAARDPGPLAREAEERLARARQLDEGARAALRERQEARAHLAALRAAAAEAFGCTAGESFLYWRRGGGERAAWAVALADAAGPGIRVEARRLYALSRAGGAPSLAPVEGGADAARPRAARARRGPTSGRRREDRRLARRS